jgi:hypothetical protein
VRGQLPKQKKRDGGLTLTKGVSRVDLREWRRNGGDQERNGETVSKGLGKEGKGKLIQKR